MSEQNQADLLNRAVMVIRETYLNQDQPWFRSRQELQVKEGFVPDAILVHADDTMSGAIDPGDVFVHAICVCVESCELCVVEEDSIEFPLLDDMEDMPANYCWLVIPEDIELDEDSLDMLEDECTQRGIGLIMSNIEEDHDEIFIDPEPLDGQFLTAYSDWHGILSKLQEQVVEPRAFEGLEDMEEEFHYQKSDWDDSEDY